MGEEGRWEGKIRTLEFADVPDGFVDAGDAHVGFGHDFLVLLLEEQKPNRHEVAHKTPELQVHVERQLWQTPFVPDHQ